jgi:hypothetical protein
MATLAQTSVNQAGPFTPTKLALGASDTFTFTSGSNQLLILYNTTASPVVVTLDGSGGTTVTIPNTGQTYDVSAGLAITVPANAFKAVRLDTISAYCAGTIALTGGTGVHACLLG